MRGTLFVAFIFLCSATGSYATDCLQTRQLTYDGLSQRLATASNNPQSVSLAERYCLAGIIGQISGQLDRNLTTLSSSDFSTIAKAVKHATPDLNKTQALSSAALFKTLKQELDQSCTVNIRGVQADALTPEQAGACGVVRLPGTPAGLGKFTAKYESGRLEGGYASISADHGAGGWTYGKYQLASERGGIKQFLGSLLCNGDGPGCLNEGYRPIGEALLAAGGIRGAQAHTAEFVATWERLSLNDRRMQQAQESHQVLAAWRPAQRVFAGFQIDLNAAACGLREQAFAMRTQHSLDSTRQIFEEAIKIAGKTDGPQIVVEANKYRLSKLGKPSGYYSRYGAVCDGREPPDGDVTKAYSCSYIKGVRARWNAESHELSQFAEISCPF